MSRLQPEDLSEPSCRITIARHGALVVCMSFAERACRRRVSPCIHANSICRRQSKDLGAVVVIDDVGVAALDVSCLGKGAIADVARGHVALVAIYRHARVMKSNLNGRVLCAQARVQRRPGDRRATVGMHTQRRLGCLQPVKDAHGRLRVSLGHLTRPLARYLRATTSVSTASRRVLFSYQGH